LQNAPPKNMPVITRVLWLRGYPKNEMRPRHFIQGVCEMSLLAEAEINLHSQRPWAIPAVEQMLTHHSTNVLAPKLLAQATLNPNMPRTALLAALVFR